MALTVTATHELRTTQVNSGGFVALCKCGWSGNVRQVPHHYNRRTKRHERRFDLAKQCAYREWSAHCALEVQIETALKIERAKAIVHRPGRFGDG